MTTHDVFLYVFDSLADWEPGHAVAGINNPAYQREPGRFRIRTVGASRDPVTTAGGVRILPDVGLDELRADGAAMLILPGGEAWETGANDAAAERAGEFLDAGVPVAAICAATAGLARTGVLDDRTHTSNAPDYLLATGYAGAAHYRDAPAVADRDVVTASGVAPVEFAREVFRRLDLYDPDTLEMWYGMFRGPAAG